MLGFFAPTIDFGIFEKLFTSGAIKPAAISKDEIYSYVSALKEDSKHGNRKSSLDGISSSVTESEAFPGARW